MKAVLQVVTHATVRVDGGITGQIGPGLLVFLGVAEEDEQEDLDKIVTMVMLVDVSSTKLDFGELSDKLAGLGKELGVEIRIQHEDIFNSMHRI